MEIAGVSIIQRENRYRRAFAVGGVDHWATQAGKPQALPLMLEIAKAAMNGVLHHGCQKMCGSVGAVNHALVQSQSAQSSASPKVQATHGALSRSDGRLFKDGCVEALEAKAVCAAVAVVLCEAVTLSLRTI
jgi:hypothetical protein